MAKDTPVVPTKAWHGDDPLELKFPDTWHVVTCKMNGHSAPKMDEAAMRKAFANPIGTKTIAELAKEKSEAAIIIDDMTRPTAYRRLYPYRSGGTQRRRYQG